MRATITPREEMVQNWQDSAPPVAPVSGPPPRALNLNHVMDLGNTVFFIFRGRAFGIPPLAWREGEKILDVWLEAQSFGGALERENLRAYYGCIKRLQKLTWKNCRPSGPIRRFLRLLHLHPNPFRRATEGELAELAVFMLGRRMRGTDPAPTLARTPDQSPGT